jgi:NAD(P)-dependent dehydrogenase (short-subunit alcohol dehydrogenase family)
VRQLDGKVAIVTGAGAGVGRGAAIALARAGAKTVVSSRTVAKCEKVVADISDVGGEAIAVECDVTQPAHIDATVARAVETYGGIDILVNAADDPLVDVPFLDITEEIMNKSWRTGVLGTLRFTHAVVPHLLEREDRDTRSIINVASGSGLLASIGMAAYSACQEAIRSLTRTAAVELGPLGIRINVICPTAWSESLDRWIDHDPSRVAAYEATAPLRRIGDPVEDIGEGIVFLASAQSRYVTGTTLMLDGGRTYLR